MRYVPKSQGTPVFVYELPYGVFEEYAYENRDYYGDDPDWDVVKEDYMAMVADSLSPVSLEVDDINRRAVYHTVHFEESQYSYSFVIWIEDRPTSRLHAYPDDVMNERDWIVARIERIAGRNGFYVDYYPEQSQEWRMTAGRGRGL